MISRYRRVCVDQIVVALTPQAGTPTYTLYKIVSFDTNGAVVEDLVPDVTSTTPSAPIPRPWQDLFYTIPLPSSGRTSGSDVYALFDLGAGMAPDWSSVYYHVHVKKRSKTHVTVVYDGTDDTTIPLSVTYQTATDPITVPAVIVPECIAGSKALEETLVAVQQKRLPNSRAQVEAQAAAAAAPTQPPVIDKKRRREPDDTGQERGQKIAKVSPPANELSSTTPSTTAPTPTSSVPSAPPLPPPPPPRRIRIPLPPPKRTVDQAVTVLPAACTPLTEEERTSMAEACSSKTASNPSSTYTSLLGCVHPYDGIVMFSHKNITAAPYVMMT